MTSWYQIKALLLSFYDVRTTFIVGPFQTSLHTGSYIDSVYFDFAKQSKERDSYEIVDMK